jgi:Mn-dependent DtxR family transcriptional regulator
MNLHESGEMYLETILILSKELPVVRAVDITEALKISKASVSVALKNLDINGYINIDKRKYITLTKKGILIAKKIYERHEIITAILISMGVNSGVAEADACKIEHDISKESFDAIKKYFDYK